MDIYVIEVPPGGCEQHHVTQTHALTNTHTHTHKLEHKSEPQQSFADISPPATTHKNSTAAYSRGRKNMEEDCFSLSGMIIPLHRHWM